LIKCSKFIKESIENDSQVLLLRIKSFKKVLGVSELLGFLDLEDRRTDSNERKLKSTKINITAYNE